MIKQTLGNYAGWSLAVQDNQEQKRKKTFAEQALMKMTKTHFLLFVVEQFASFYSSRRQINIFLIFTQNRVRHFMQTN